MISIERSNSRSSYFSLLKRDVEYYLKDKKSLAIFISVFLSGLLIFLVALKNMLGNSDNYYRFLLVGYLVVAYMNISAGSGFEIINDSYEGKLAYDKTLPVKRVTYAFIRILGISLRGYINFLICFFIMLPFLFNYFTIENIFIFLLLSYILSVIFTGISILPLMLTSNLTVQSVIGALLRSYFFLGSTIFYPLNLVPENLKFIILLNPVTWILEMIRSSMNIPYATRFSFGLSILAITTYLLFSVIGGIYVLLHHKIEV